MTLAPGVLAAAGGHGAGGGQHQRPGRAVLADPIKPKLKLPGTKRLKQICDEQLSKIAFKSRLRRYNLVKLEGDREISREEFDKRARASVLVGCCRLKPIKPGVGSTPSASFQRLELKCDELSCFHMLLSIQVAALRGGAAGGGHREVRGGGGGGERHGAGHRRPLAVLRARGRALHSSTFQLNPSRFRHKIYPKHPMIRPNTP